MKKVSVIITAYNIADRIGNCIKSVLNQDYSNLDIVIVNDGSTDGTLAAIKEAVVNDPRVRIINTMNGGAGAARNRGLEAASGDEVTFIDGDDWVEPNYVSALLKQRKKYCSDISITFSKIFRSNTNQFLVMLHPAPGDTSYDHVYTPTEWLKTFWQTPSMIANSACCKLYSKSLFDRIKFREHHYVMEDADIAWKLILSAERVSFENILTYVYRTNQAVSLTTNQQTFNYKYAEVNILEQRIAVMKAAGLDEHYMLVKYQQSLQDLYHTALNHNDHAKAKTTLVKLNLLNRNFKGEIQ